MATNEIEKEVRIDAPIDVVWETITDPDHLSRWFADKVELDAKPGAGMTVTWNDHNVTENLRVESVDKPNLFSLRWMNPKDEAPTTSNSTLIEFKLTADGDATVLRLIESGFDQLDWTEETKASTIEGHIEGWTIHTDALGRYFAGQREVSARP